MRIIDISTLIFFLEKALSENVGEKVTTLGRLKDFKNIATKENRIFFNIDNPLSMGLKTVKNGLDGYSYEGQGTLTFFYPQNYTQSSDFILKEDFPFYKLENKEKKKGSEIQLNFNFLELNYDPTQVMEWGGYMLEIPFTFKAILFSLGEDVGEIETFEIEQERNGKNIKRKEEMKK